MATINPQAQIQAALMPAALPQTLEPVTTKKRQVQYTQYDPQSVAAYNEAMGKVAPRASTAELLANALANIDDAPSYEGAYDTQVSNPLVSGITNALQGFGGMYGARKQQEREYLTDMLNADRERARIQMEMGKKNITEAEENGVMKVNKSGNDAGGNTGIMGFLNTPMPMKVSELNEKAGRWDTNKYNPSDPEQGFWASMGARMLPGRDYGVSLSRGEEDAKNFQLFETQAMQGMFDVLKALRPATDTDVMVAMRTAGADPLLDKEVRDQRLTRVLNNELTKIGLPTVSNLAGWDRFVEDLYAPGGWQRITGQTQTNPTTRHDDIFEIR